MKLFVVGNGSTAQDESGCAYVNRHTADFLAALGCRFGRVAWLEPGDAFDRNSNLQNAVLDPTLVESLRIQKSLGGLARSYPVLDRLVASDFVYLFFPGTLPRLVAKLCQLMGKPYGVYLRGEKFSLDGSDGRLLRKAKFIISVSPSLSTGLEALNSHVDVIRPMLDLTMEDAFTRTFATVTGRPWRLLFVGRLEGSKGVPELIEAARILERSDARFELRLVGGGPLFNSLQELSLPGSIRLVGQVAAKAELLAHYEWADLFVLPSHHEGFPRVLYEAMIKSTVILTTFVGGIPGVMQAGVNCEKLPLHSAEGIAEAIKRALADRAHLQALSDAARDTIIHILASRPSHVEAFTRRLVA